MNATVAKELHEVKGLPGVRRVRTSPRVSRFFTHDIKRFFVLSGSLPPRAFSVISLQWVVLVPAPVQPSLACVVPLGSSPK